MAELQAMIHQTHPYVALYKSAYQIMAETPPEQRQNMRVLLRADRTQDQRRYNLPTANEIAVVIPGDGSEEVSDHRDVVLRLQGGGLHRISHLNPAYSPLHYVLLFPHGEDGWHPNIPAQLGATGRGRSANVTQRCYYAHRLHVRPGGVNQPALFRSGKLFQQYIVDAWASAEQSALNWARTHQKELRADVYRGLRDAAMGDREQNLDLQNHGQRLILPSTHIGSERNMLQLFQDSMAICREFRKPDLFVTMTANPNWPEVLESLLNEGGPNGMPQTAADRPDIMSRVFEGKRDSLYKEIKNGIFGKTLAMVHTIEFQKRGLPHMHLLVFLHPDDKIRNAADVDSVVSAQIPNPVTQPILYEVITKNMVHGPCGAEKPSAKCMADGRCTKQYPKELRETTHFGDDGYPLYARPNNGHFFEKNGHRYTNRDVVPYSPYLSARYNCHINVEICASVQAIKYIHKYIYKGHDRTTLEISDQNRNEIKEYLDSRYISAAESCWRIFEFNMHKESPSVTRLPVHLEDEQLVYFNADDNANDVIERGNSRHTPLTAWFQKNRVDPAARTTLYQDFPKKYWYVKRSQEWRARTGRNPPAIGRMYFASPASGERFYLRLLLTAVAGAQSFHDLRRFNGILYQTYKEACNARGLLEDDREWEQCLQEAAQMQTGSALRSLFAVILLSCFPASPEVLWNRYKAQICDDLRRRLERHPQFQNHHFDDEKIYDYGLHLLNKVLMRSGKTLSDFPPMPLPQGPLDGQHWEDILDNFLLAQQLDYDPQQQADLATQNFQAFTQEQKNIFNAVMDSVNNGLGKSLFTHSAGGCGKTFVCNTIAASVRSQNQIALCVASSGIASLLLEGGRTAHSTFKIPIPAIETSIAGIKRNTLMHDVLKHTKIIIWDEVPMQHKHAVTSVDRLLRDLLGEEGKPFGGITVLFGGDFRQTLPVVPRALRQEIVSASIARSPLWNHIEVHYLTQNMRLDRTLESEAHAAWLLQIGAGTNMDEAERINVPENMCCRPNTLDRLIDETYPNIHLGNRTNLYFLERSILCCKNDDVDDINRTILGKMPGIEKVLLSADSVHGTNENQHGYQPYATEYLNSLTASGLPLSRLSLKVGCPVMLLRNLDPSRGLCNGTRLIVKDIKNRAIKCEIISGDARFSGKIVLIPRISLEPSAENLPIPLRRRQFPIRLAFAMTINKSQGQGLHIVGLNLQTHVFSHGQLYVAFSRCTSGNRIKVLLPEGNETKKIPNVVYKEVLQGLNL